MNRDEIYAKVTEVLEDALGVDEDEVQPTATLTSDLGVAIGLGYALVWVAFAARAVRSSPDSQATAHRLHSVAQGVFTSLSDFNPL